MYKDITLKDFIDELSSSSPAPGGGSAAALSAALGSSLISMVFNLTVGKKSYESLDDNIKDKIKCALLKENENKIEFLDCIDKDADAFLSLMEAFKMPKDTEDNINLRKSKIDERTLKAAESPMELAENAYNVYDNVYLAASYGNKNAVSDAGVAALMIQSAIEGAVLNVKINLSSVKDEKLKKDLTAKCDYWVREGMKKKEEILNLVIDKIK